MAGITLAEAETHLAQWLAADSAVAQGQAYSIAGRMLTRADAAAITEKIKFWRGEAERLQTGIRMRAAVPV